MPFKKYLNIHIYFVHWNIQCILQVQLKKLLKIFISCLKLYEDSF